MRDKALAPAPARGSRAPVRLLWQWAKMGSSHLGKDVIPAGGLEFASPKSIFRETSDQAGQAPGGIALGGSSAVDSLCKGFWGPAQATSYPDVQGQ